MFNLDILFLFNIDYTIIMILLAADDIRFVYFSG